MSAEIEREMDGVIVLDKDYTLKKNMQCWTLLYMRKKKTKDGSKDTLDYVPSYHATIAAALQFYVDQQAKKASGDVAAMLNEVRAAMARIEEIFKDVPSTLAKLKVEE